MDREALKSMKARALAQGGEVRGNTGASKVSAFETMAIAPELERLL